MIDEGKKNTIRYNVGGHIFEVSRDVVNRHPTTILAETASEFMHNSSPDAIFIDGNAERFGFVLDYLLTGRAVLPINIPKAAFLRDLNFYGFQNIESSNVDTTSASADVVAQITKLEENYKQNLKERDAEIVTLQLKQSCFFVAHECFLYYIPHDTSESLRLDGKSESEVYRCFSNFNEVLLNEMLVIYGLKYVSHNTEYAYNNASLCVTLRLSKLSDKVIQKEKETTM